MAILNFPKTPQQRIDQIRFQCSCCENWKSGMMDLAKILPDPVVLIPEEQRQGRVLIGSDLCSIDNEIFLVRAVLYLPIQKTNAEFGFGVWGSLAQQNYQTYFDGYDNPNPTFGPFFSWLCSSLPPFGMCEEVAANMVFRSGNQRPVMHLHESDHPLAVAQHEGITVNQVKEIYAAWGHMALL